MCAVASPLLHVSVLVRFWRRHGYGCRRGRHGWLCLQTWTLRRGGAAEYMSMPRAHQTIRRVPNRKQVDDISAAHTCAWRFRAGGMCTKYIRTMGMVYCGSYHVHRPGWIGQAFGIRYVTRLSCDVCCMCLCTCVREWACWHVCASYAHVCMRAIVCCLCFRCFGSRLVRRGVCFVC